MIIWPKNLNMNCQKEHHCPIRFENLCMSTHTQNRSIHQSSWKTRNILVNKLYTKTMPRSGAIAKALDSMSSTDFKKYCKMLWTNIKDCLNKMIMPVNRNTKTKNKKQSEKRKTYICLPQDNVFIQYEPRSTLAKFSWDLINFYKNLEHLKKFFSGSNEFMSLSDFCCGSLWSDMLNVLSCHLYFPFTAKMSCLVFPHTYTHTCRNHTWQHFSYSFILGSRCLPVWWKVYLILVSFATGWLEIISKKRETSPLHFGHLQVLSFSFPKRNFKENVPLCTFSSWHFVICLHG